MYYYSYADPYFTAAVLFGSRGARKVFGTGGIYTVFLSALPISSACQSSSTISSARCLARTHWAAKKRTVMPMQGGSYWRPYNLACMWTAIIPGRFGRVFLRQHYLAFWAK